MLNKGFEENILHSKDAFAFSSTSDARPTLPMAVAPKCMFDCLQSIIDLNAISLLVFSNPLVESMPAECDLVVERIILTILHGAS